MERIIFDTDLGGDIDDLGALALLHTLADNGEASILATISSTGKIDSPVALNIVNSYFGRPNIQVGYRDGFLSDYDPNIDDYAEVIAKDSRFQQYKTIESGNDAISSTSLYLSTLNSQPDNSVTIITVGDLSNIKNLLSTEEGKQAVTNKVEKIVIMGGRYPSSGGNAEANFANPNPGVSQFAIDNIPSNIPIIFSGAEIGEIGKGYETGARISELAEDNPIKVGFGAFFNNPPQWAYFATSPGSPISDWAIYDSAAVMVGVRGGDPYFNVVDSGSNQLNYNGSNQWIDSIDKNHSYLTPKMAPSEFADIVEELILGVSRSIPNNNVEQPIVENIEEPIIENRDLFNESVQIDRSPILIDSQGIANISLDYETNNTRNIRVDLFEGDFSKWRGSEVIENISGSGELDISINYSGNAIDNGKVSVKLLPQGSDGSNVIVDRIFDVPFISESLEIESESVLSVSQSIPDKNLDPSITENTNKPIIEDRDLFNESVQIDRSAIVIDDRGIANISVDYETNNTRNIRVDLFEGDFSKWRGSEVIENVSGSGELDISINYSGNSIDNGKVSIKLLPQGSDGGDALIDNVFTIPFISESNNLI